ncbi:MAG: copper resistance protein CopC, partial [Acidimicrobiales bacterium]|nr:copper resistance protein CopC [Acidimicrobiales bacterium]
MHDIGRRRPSAVRILLLVVVALGLVGGFAPTRADAHAVLEASTPPDGARLQRVPATITLRFSESVTVPSGGVKAVGPGGTSVGTGNVKTEGATVTVPLRSGLGDGGYIVSWRVISADSHPIDGGISFVVGNGAVPSKDAVSKIGGHDRPWRVAGALLRIVTYTAGALLVGGILFLTLVHEPGADARHHTRTVALAGVVTTVAALAQLVVQAALASGRGPLALFRGSIG